MQKLEMTFIQDHFEPFLVFDIKTCSHCKKLIIPWFLSFLSFPLSPPIHEKKKKQLNKKSSFTLPRKRLKQYNILNNFSIFNNNFYCSILYSNILIANTKIASHDVSPFAISATRFSSVCDHADLLSFRLCIHNFSCESRWTWHVKRFNIHIHL